MGIERSVSNLEVIFQDESLKIEFSTAKSKASDARLANPEE
jgi:hypothetical protein